MGCQWMLASSHLLKQVICVSSDTCTHWKVIESLGSKVRNVARLEVWNRG